MLGMVKMCQGTSSNFHLEKHFKSGLPNFHEIDFHYRQSVRSVFLMCLPVLHYKDVKYFFLKNEVAAKTEWRMHYGSVMLSVAFGP